MPRALQFAVPLVVGLVLLAGAWLLPAATGDAPSRAWVRRAGAGLAAAGVAGLGLLVAGAFDAHRARVLAALAVGLAVTALLSALGRSAARD